MRRQIGAAPRRRGQIGRRHGLAQRFGHAANQIAHGDRDFGRALPQAHRRQRPEVDDDRRDVFVGHGAEPLVRHHRKQRPAVVSDAFAYRARQLIVGPVARAGFRIGREVRRHHAAGKAVHRHLLAGAEHVGLDRRIVLLPPVRRMAFHARRDVFDQIRAAGQAFGRRRKSSRRERARTRTDERPPSDGDGNSRDEHRDQRNQRPQDDVHHLFHVATLPGRSRARS